MYRREQMSIGSYDWLDVRKHDYDWLDAEKHEQTNYRRSVREKHLDTPTSSSDKGWTKYGLLRTGVSVKVPEDNKAKLMYYVACISSVLDLGSQRNVVRMCDYKKFYLLTEHEIDDLLYTCYSLNPDILIGKCLFKDEEICIELQNEFYEMSYFQRRFGVAPVVTVLGEPRRVRKVMFFKLEFLADNYYRPMLHFKPRVEKILNSETKQLSHLGSNSENNLSSYGNPNTAKSRSCNIL